MKILAIAVAFALILLLHSQATATPPPAEPPTLEHKLDVLANCGLRLAAPFTPEYLLTACGREEYEEPGTASS